MPDDDQPRAWVHKVGDQHVLVDPAGSALIEAVEKHNCKLLLDANAVRIAHFVRRIGERGESVQNVVIVILNVDDPHGGPLAEQLMPGHNWDLYRDRGARYPSLGGSPCVKASKTSSTSLTPSRVRSSES